MKRTMVFLLLLVMLLAGCARTQTDVPDTPEAQASQALVEQYLTANREYDADALLALYSDDLYYMDYGSNDGPISKGNLNYFVPEVMSTEGFKLKLHSYVITPDGRFAALNVDYAEVSVTTGKWVSVPCVALLEFNKGLIVSETWYYNGEALH